MMALPGFGKTLLITLPILVLKQYIQKKCVSFIMSPYIVLVRDMVQRLGKKLRVGLVKSLFGESNYGLKKGIFNEDLMDIYCGSYNDFANPAFQELVSNWSFFFPDAVLCYLVIDESHNIVTERDYSADILDIISSGNYSFFAKMILLSGTIYKKLYEEVIKCFNIRQPLTDDYSNYSEDSVYLWNTIRAIPLKNVIKSFKCYQSKDVLLGKAVDIVRWFVNNRKDERCIVVCQEKSTVRYLQSQLLDVTLSVTGDNDSQEKLDVLDANWVIK